MSPIERKEAKLAYFMLAPAVILLTIFVISPLIMAIERSFYDWNFYIESVFVGFDNYRIILETVHFRQAVLNSLKFVVLIVPTMMILSFLVALLFTELGSRFTKFAKTAIYIPGIISGIIASVIFIFVLEYRGGLLNQMLMNLGFERIAWLTDEFWATLAITATSVWLGLGANVILMYAGLMNIPTDYYEAASIDGAGAWHKMIKITIPQMVNIFILVCINLTSATLQLFDTPFLITGGGPRNTTLTPMLYLYNNYRDVSKSMGYTIAGALMMMVLIAVINSIVFSVIRSEKMIDG